jgi:hypothetical protein
MNDKERKEYLDACIYYHGEADCPYDDCDGRLFWVLERNAFYIQDTYLEKAIERQKILEESFPDLPPLFARLSNKYIRASFVLFIFQQPMMLGDYDFSQYLRYGDKIKTKVEKDDDWLKAHYKIDGLPYCRYYHGEDENPYKPGDIRATYWSGEEGFVKRCCPASAADDGFRVKIVYPFALDFTELYLKPTPEKPFYTYLLATLYEQYITRWGGTKEGFLDWVKKYETTEP